ncbi:MAG: hypothetical protein ACTSUE_07760 [Promethearchaeota archaeon]
MDFLWDSDQFNKVEDLLVDLVHEIVKRYGHKVKSIVEEVRNLETIRNVKQELYQTAKRILVLLLLGNPFFPEDSKQITLVEKYIRQSPDPTINSVLKGKVSVFLNILISIREEVFEGSLPMEDIVIKAKNMYAIA